MTEGRGWNWQAVGVILALLCSIVSTSVLFGQTRGQVERNTEDIRDMKSESRKMQDTLNTIDLRTARMEERLEILLPTSAVKEHDR